MVENLAACVGIISSLILRMNNWFFENSTQLTVAGQMIYDTVKILLTFATVLIVTRWTLARADRKDAIQRQASTLQNYTNDRIQSLTLCVVALSKIQQRLSFGLTIVDSEMTTAERAEALSRLFEMCEEYLDEFLLSAERYGEVPASIPNDYDTIHEAGIDWMREFYAQFESEFARDNLGAAHAVIRELKTELRWLKAYEINMGLQVANNPASAWDPGFGEVMESTYLGFLSSDKPWSQNMKSRVVGTVHEVIPSSKEKKNRSKKVLIFNDFDPDSPVGDVED